MQQSSGSRRRHQGRLDGDGAKREVMRSGHGGGKELRKAVTDECKCSMRTDSTQRWRGSTDERRAATGAGGGGGSTSAMMDGKQRRRALRPDTGGLTGGSRAATRMTRMLGTSQRGVGNDDYQHRHLEEKQNQKRGGGALVRS